MYSKTINISDLKRIQMRLKENMDTVEEYAQALTNGEEFPLIQVANIGDTFYVWDGSHRLAAYEKVGRKEIQCQVSEVSSIEEVRWLAMGANRSNGLRLTKLDKAAILQAALIEYPMKTSKEIADHIGCSRSYVDSIRADLIAKGKIQPRETPKDKVQKALENPQSETKSNRQIAKEVGVSEKTVRKIREKEGEGNTQQWEIPEPQTPDPDADALDKIAEETRAKIEEKERAKKEKRKVESRTITIVDSPDKQVSPEEIAAIIWDFLQPRPAARIILVDELRRMLENQ